MTVGIHPGGQHADFRCDIENVRDAARHYETVGYLALCDDDGSIGPTEGDAGKSRGGGRSLEGIFHLVESALGGKDGDVMIVVAVARHDGNGVIVIIVGFESVISKTLWTNNYCSQREIKREGFELDGIGSKMRECCCCRCGANSSETSKDRRYTSGTNAPIYIQFE